MTSPLSTATPHAHAGELFSPALRARVVAARDSAVAALLRERNTAGHWTGELSASALSTATALVALTLVARSNDQDTSRRRRLHALIARGYAWLVAHQNADGGWGDTTRSCSNISTTTIVWAALALADFEAMETSALHAASARAAAWLVRAAGSVAPEPLVAAVERRYGRDKTFSIPILTLCALCGKLGPAHEGWRRVRQLPFELAALPQRWFGALQLPVVSYALPALIAIGQVRHAHAPSGNPLARALRDRVRERTLQKLTQLQPANGGFLEATPLTSFVTMSLAGMGLAAHPVAARGVAFLEASARPDGSWPIDTNLATWVTTLSVNALAGDMSGVARRVSGGTEVAPAARSSLRSRTGLPFDSSAALSLRDWLLGQQYRVVHPYTLAAPGGWAWTDLPGGVPDADDTPGAILALAGLAPEDAAARRAMSEGARWLLDLQNRDGGIPTFCRGWGKLPFDRSSADLTAHTIRAWLAVRVWSTEREQSRIDTALARATRFLLKTQRPDGAWVPLWFGHQEHAADENPLYGTARVVPALVDLRHAKAPAVAAALDRAVAWLIAQQNDDGGWSGAAGAQSSVEETGVAVEALAAAWRPGGNRATDPAHAAALQRGAAWLADAIERETWRTASPIGFYFAKLWYFERLYPLIFATGALVRVTALAGAVR